MASAVAARFEVKAAPVLVRANPIDGIVNNAELDEILKSVRPYIVPTDFAGVVPVSLTLHALRLWGADTEFPPHPSDGTRKAIALNGRQMLGSLLDHRKFAVTSQLMSEGMLVRSKAGIRVVTAAQGSHGAIETSTHFGKLGQVMAEIGAPSHEPVFTRDEYEGELAEILHDDALSIASGSELEFVACGLARYAAGSARWTNRFGDEWSFDRIASELMEQAPGSGACGGVHVPHALTILLAVNREHSILSEGTATMITLYLQNLSETLTRTQRPDGRWDWDWLDDLPHTAAIDRPSLYRDDLIASVGVTGHHMEWMALAPSDCRPRDEVIRHAAKYLVRSWRSVSSAIESDWHSYFPATHAARALWLLSGQHGIEKHAI